MDSFTIPSEMKINETKKHSSGKGNATLFYPV